ncbi:hypothetical protein OsI_22617 [Oryza sativa Indica Group]|uniref:Uncharacterized protein n=1 Tax=Oryza sativa subsp. indica TaxID=39946 RepID=B8B0U5_ORYSI|nr:hypothetical protein OsI_22617 [Oryza sativa Indica Group]
MGAVDPYASITPEDESGRIRARCCSAPRPFPPSAVTIFQKLHIRPLLVSAGRAQGLAAGPNLQEQEQRRWSEPAAAAEPWQGRRRMAGWSSGGARAGGGEQRRQVAQLGGMATASSRLGGDAFAARRAGSGEVESGGHTKRRGGICKK